MSGIEEQHNWRCGLLDRDFSNKGSGQNYRFKKTEKRLFYFYKNDSMLLLDFSLLAWNNKSD